MKNKHRPKFVKVLKPTNPFQIPKAEWPEEKEILDRISLLVLAKPGATSKEEAVDTETADTYTKALAAIATHAWKARSRMIDEETAKPRDDMKRVFRHIEAIFGIFHDIGLEVKDHTRDVFDYGMPLKVITSQPTPGINKEHVLETIKPTIYWRNRIIQMGEVVIATPA